MTRDSQFTNLLIEWLEDQPDRAPSRLLETVLTDLQSAPQRARWKHVLRRFPMFNSNGARYFAVAAVGVLAVVIGFAWLQGQRVVGPAATPSTPPPSHVATSPPKMGPGSALTWTRLDADALGLSRGSPGSTAFVARVLWLGDRYVLADRSPGTVLTSTDGVWWDPPEDGRPSVDYYEPLLMDSVFSWQDEIVGWSNVVGGNLSIVRPPNEPRTSRFDGTVGAAGIGPAGVVVRTHSTLDFDAYITSLMGTGWVDHMTSFSFTEGVLRITTDDDRKLEIVWADHGFEPGDVADRGFGWHSVDGGEWSAIPDFPDNVSDVVGTNDGFIARGGEGMWYSGDGLSWRRIGPHAPGSIVPWMGDLLVAPDRSEARQFELWTSDGARPLSFASELGVTWRPTGTGPLGIVSFGTDDSILYSPDGMDWSISPMPEGMPPHADRRISPSIAVGERSVVVLLWKWEADESHSPSLWLGTPER